MSTKGTIHSIKTGDAYCHVYTECFDESDNVFIESWIQDEQGVTSETIQIPKEVWDKLVQEIKAKP